MPYIIVPDEKTLRAAALGKFRRLPRAAVLYENAANRVVRTTNLPPAATGGVCGWFNISSIGANYRTLVTFGNAASPFNVINLTIDPSGNMALYNGGTLQMGPTVVVANRWYHWALSWSGTGATALHAYLNGGLEITHGGNASLTAVNLNFAANLIGGASDTLNGRLTQLRVWDREVSQNEYRQEMLWPFPFNWKGLNAWYPMQHANGLHLDYARGNHLTIAGTPTTTGGYGWPLRWYKKRARVFVAAGGGGEIAGTLSVTLDAVTVSSTGALLIQGATTTTLAAVTATADGDLLIQGSTSTTLADVTASATSQLAISGSLSATLADVTVTGTGSLGSTGALSATLDAATANATGQLAITGQVTATLAAATATTEGDLLIQGALSVQLDDVAVVASGGQQNSGTLTVTLGDATPSATGQLAIAASATVTLQDVAVAATGQVALSGLVTVTLAAVTVTAAGSLAIAGQLTATLESAALVATGGTGAGPSAVIAINPRLLQPSTAAWSIAQPSTAAAMLVL